MMRSRKGFSLIEVLIAMMILSSGVILLVNSWGSSYRKLKKTQIQFEMAALIERKMIELEIEYRDKPLDSIHDEREDDFGTDYPQYSWKMKSQELEIPDLTPLFTSAEGGASSELIEIVKRLTDQLSKSIREVKLTLVYKTQPKNVEYSVTRYFVDYNRSLGLPGGVSGAGGTGSAGAGTESSLPSASVPGGG
jgi:general secretion pathway protein I